jgi:hypothetical protein
LALAVKALRIRIQRPSANMLVKGDKPNQPVQIFKDDELRAPRVGESRLDRPSTL